MVDSTENILRTITRRIELGVLGSQLSKEIYFKHAVAFLTFCSRQPRLSAKAKQLILFWFGNGQV